MLAYYGYTISPNQIETGEGFLICKNVPIARIGDQQYLGREIGLTGANAERVFTVRRSPEEVFSETALASFEGKPVTDDHPPELLTPDTVTMYLKGHAENVRRGAGEWQDYVVADLHVQDRGLIDAIQRGKREISCGYECEYVHNADDTYSQKNIRGNHIAVVERGRAGKRAAILDSDTINKEKAGKRPERKTMKKHGLFFNLFGQAVSGKSPEEIEQMAMDAAAALDEDENAGGQTSEEKKDEEKPAVKDAAFFDALDKKIDRLLAVVDQKSADEGGEEDPMDAAIKKLEGSEEKKAGDEGASEEAKVVPAEEMDTDNNGSMDQAMAAAILKAARPAVAAISDPKQRKAVTDALIGAVMGSGNGENDLSKLMKTVQKNAQKTADSKSSMDEAALQAAYDNMNPHKKAENGGK